MVENILQGLGVAFIWFHVLMPMINKVTEPSVYDECDCELCSGENDLYS